MQTNTKGTNKIEDRVEATIDTCTLDTAFSKMKLKTMFTMPDSVLEALNIPKLTLDKKENPNNEPEVWTFAKFAKGTCPYNKERKYLISSYGRVYNIKKKKLLPQFKHLKVANGESYRAVNISHEDDFGNKIQKKCVVHRLVAYAFLKKKKNKNVVDHIDEVPYHNYAWNLQWTDKSGNANKHNMYVKRNRDGKAVNTIWKHSELVSICKMIADGHKATYIYNEMKKLTNNDPKIQYERIRTLYKHIMRRGDFNDIAVACGVRFGSDTMKEAKSVEKMKELKMAENKVYLESIEFNVKKSKEK